MLLVVRRLLLACVIGASSASLWAEELPPGVSIVGLAPGAAAGEPAKPAETVSLTAAKLKDLPRVTLEGKDRDGMVHRFEGVELHELLARVHVSTGETLRGPRMRELVLIEGRDGYGVCFSLAELSPAFTDRKILLADTSDGQPLATGVGPLRIIVEGEKRHSRWVRDVVSIRVLQATSPASAPEAK